MNSKLTLLQIYLKKFCFNHIETIKIYIEYFIPKSINIIDFSNKFKYFIILLPLLKKGYGKDSNEIMLLNFIKYFYKHRNKINI